MFPSHMNSIVGMSVHEIDKYSKKFTLYDFPEFIVLLDRVGVKMLAAKCKIFEIIKSGYDLF